MVLVITDNTISLLMDNQEHARMAQALLKLMESTRMEKRLRTTNIVRAFAKESKLTVYLFSIGSLSILDSLTKAISIRKVNGGK
jgi:hypothetical protein